tara:strand:+ start:1540 stop:1791 length:252 start_codon:yes stop_codon:yes gene_type:complete
MMNIDQSIFDVAKVRASSITPSNSNCVTVKIETEGGTLQQHLYFGNGTKEDGEALAFFFALGGHPADVTGSEAALKRKEARGY